MKVSMCEKMHLQGNGVGWFVRYVLWVLRGHGGICITMGTMESGQKNNKGRSFRRPKYTYLFNRVDQSKKA